MIMEARGSGRHIIPKNTSRDCSICGYTDKNNRKNQAEFVCLKCGHTELADYNASKNILARALVNVPIAICPEGKLNRKPTTLSLAIDVRAVPC